MLYHPYSHDVILIDPTRQQLRAVLDAACLVANARARVRMVTRPAAREVFRSPSGQWNSLATNVWGGPRSAGMGGVRSVLGYAWATVGDGRKHVRVVGGRVYPRASLWGAIARPEELVYPDPLERIATMWGYDGVVKCLLSLASEEPLKERIATYRILADRLEELGAGDEAALMRRGRRGKCTCPPPGPGGSRYNLAEEEAVLFCCPYCCTADDICEHYLGSKDDRVSADFGIGDGEPLNELADLFEELTQVVGRFLSRRHRSDLAIVKPERLRDLLERIKRGPPFQRSKQDRSTPEWEGRAFRWYLNSALRSTKVSFMAITPMEENRRDWRTNVLMFWAEDVPMAIEGLRRRVKQDIARLLKDLH